MTHLEDLNILNTLLSPPSNVYFYPLPNDALDIRRKESRQCKVMPRVKSDHIASSLNWVGLKERVLALGLFWGGGWQYSGEVVLKSLGEVLAFVSRGTWGINLP